MVRDTSGAPQRLVVFGLGKLGGGELNFSSDIDLVYAYPHDGESDGRRVLAAEDYFARLGQRLTKLLDEVTGDGFCHRVDLRLRPFGNAGRVAWSFAAMDQYFQREGRDWERYAWLKARAVAGDVEAGEAWLETLRPFVYRRYLDYTALDGLRTMKAAIVAEMQRRDMVDDLKRGPGGIREIEFLVQSLQLIRGGREPALRGRRLLPALEALVAAGQIASDHGRALADAYRFLRRLENRVQMLHDAQTHALPDSTEERQRMALALGYEGWEALQPALARCRAGVSAEFDALLVPRRGEAAPDALESYWRALPEGGEAQALADAGFGDAAGADASLRDFARGNGVRALSDAARARLDRVVPALLGAAAHSAQPDAALRRLLGLLQAVLRRASYLALLDEQPSALARLVDVLARSALLAERIVAYPLLLDELLDTRVAGPMPDAAAMHAAFAAAFRSSWDDGDPESVLRAINEVRLALSFRIAWPTLDRRQSTRDGASQLAALADVVMLEVLKIAHAEVSAAHGPMPGGRFAVIGYGSLGGRELGFGSTYDLSVPLRRRCGGDVRGRAAAGAGALVFAGGTEGRRPARCGDQRRPPVRDRHAPASRRRQEPAGVVAGQLRGLPAAPRMDPSTRRWCARGMWPAMRRCAWISSGCAPARWADRAMWRRWPATSARCASACAPNWTAATRRGSTSSRVRAALSTVFPYGPVLRAARGRCAPVIAGAARHAGTAGRSGPGRCTRPGHGLVAVGGTWGVPRRRARLHARPAPAPWRRSTTRCRPRASGSPRRWRRTGWSSTPERGCPLRARVPVPPSSLACSVRVTGAWRSTLGKRGPFEAARLGVPSSLQEDAPCPTCPTCPDAVLAALAVRLATEARR